LPTNTPFLNRPLSGEELPAIEEVPFQQHPGRYLRYILLTSLSPFAFFIPVILVLMWTGLDWWAWGLCAAGLLILAFILLEEFKSFPIRGYALRERDITYRKGWLFFSRVTVPFNRIQHCEIVQGPVAQLFDLAELRIYTAGGAVSDLPVGGLPPDEAHRLREHIAKAAAIYE